MSTLFNRRRGAKANKPRAVRLCDALCIDRSTRTERRYPGGVSGTAWMKPCGAAVSPNLNGNRCEEHRR